MDPLVFVGIDVSKGHLDVAARPAAPGAPDAWRVANDTAGIDGLVTRLAALAPSLVVLEATGGYEAACAAALATAGLPVAVVNPRQARDFARSTGRLAKTDGLDADALALFAERVRPEPRPLPDEAAAALTALLARRRQLVEMLVAEKNRRLVAPLAVRKGIAKHVAWLERGLSDVEGDLAAARSNPPVRALYERLVAKGKPKKVAVVACMRKLLVTANAVARSGRAWEAGYPVIA